MKVDEIIHIQKFFLMLFSSLFMILGFSIFGCAAWILFDENSFVVIISSESNVKLVGVSLAVIGLVVVGVSLLACVGGRLENKLLLKTHMGFLLIITFGQIFVAMVLFLRRPQIEEFLVRKFNETIEQYGNETANLASWTMLDRVQRSAHCCGINSTTDWEYNVIIQSFEMNDVYPCSCFNDTCPFMSGETHFGMGTHIYTEGCQTKLTRWLQDNIIVIIGMALAVIFVQILQFTFAVLIYKNIGRKMKMKHQTSLIGSMEVDPQTEAVYQDGNPDFDHQSDDQQQQQNQQDYEQQHAHQSDYQQQQYHQQDYYQQEQYHQSDSQQQQYDQQDYHQQEQYRQSDYQQQQYDQQEQYHQSDYQQQQYHQQEQYHQSDYQQQQQQYHQQDYHQQEQYHQSDYQQQQYHQQDYHQQEQGQYNQQVYNDLQYY